MTQALERSILETKTMQTTTTTKRPKTIITSGHLKLTLPNFVLFKASQTLALSLVVLILVVCSIIQHASSTQKTTKVETDKKTGDIEEEPQLVIHSLFKPEQCDRRAKSTDVLTLHYRGSIQGSDSIFDSSYDRNEPFTFQLGIGQVIRGWEKGLVGACVGEKRQLVIPPHLGYGNAKHDQIPPGSTLIFDIEILKVEEGPTPMLNVFKEIDVDTDGRLTRKEVGEFLRAQLAQANRHGDSGSADDPDQVQMVDEIFMHEDKDKDGYITHDEFSGPKYDHDEL
uniref:peptidylprolyl isomerase n=1 Tax=Aceria tosichella TaxID=561515 RepID=A0A6G1S4R3_9ACAR